MQEITFKLQRDSPYNHLSGKYPTVPISTWCDHNKDVLEIKCDDIALFEKLQEDLVNLCYILGTPILRKVFGPKNVQVVVKHCSCYYQDSILESVSRYNLLYIPPVSHKGGWEHYKVIGFEARDMRRFFRDLSRKAVVEILSKKNASDRSVTDSFTVSIGSLFAGLTEKQTEAFVLALDNGHYEIPKRITLDQIAKINRVPRTTYEDKVRKAESKIMQAIGPYIRMRHA